MEEVLPYFPDFLILDKLKPNLCAALERKQEKLLQMKVEYDDYASTAATIRKDIMALKKT